MIDKIKACRDSIVAIEKHMSDLETALTTAKEALRTLSMEVSAVEDVAQQTVAIRSAINKDGRIELVVSVPEELSLWCKKTPIKWTPELVLETASMFTSKKKWKSNYPGAVYAAHRFGIIRQVKFKGQ